MQDLVVLQCGRCVVRILKEKRRVNELVVLQLILYMPTGISRPLQREDVPDILLVTAGCYLRIASRTASEYFRFRASQSHRLSLTQPKTMAIVICRVRQA